MKIYGPQITGSLGINGSTIGNFNNLVSTSSFNQYTSSISTGSLATTGSNTFLGNQTMSGSVIPAITNTYDLGDATHQFRHLYLSSGSLYINGTKVLGATGQELQITTDAGQSLKILEAGSDTITLQSADGNITLATSGGGDVILDPNTGIVALKGTTTLYAGNKIVSSDGNAIQFGNDLGITGSITTTGNVNGINLTTFSSSVASTLSNQNTATSSYETKGRGIVSGSSQITYASISSIPSGIVSGSTQTIANLPTGVVSGSIQVLGGTGIISSSTQLNNTTITNLTVTNLTTVNETASVIFSSGSNRFGDFADDVHDFTGSVKISGSFTLVGSSTATSYNGIINSTNGVVSGSSQITYTSISSIPVGIVSGSTQTIANLPTGTVSGSSQVVSILSSLNTYTGSNDTLNSLQTTRIDQLAAGTASVNSFTASNGNTSLNSYTASNDTTNTAQNSRLTTIESVTGSYETKGRSIVSGSSQITYTGISSIPGGIVSGSSQVTMASTTGFGTYINQAVLTTSSPTFAGVTMNGSIGKTHDLMSEGTFGYSATYKTLKLGSTSASNPQSIAFGVDLSGNAGSSFSGYGTEYFFRNVGSFKTPNSANNEYNTLLSWNNIGGITFGGSEITSSGDITITNCVDDGLRLEGSSPTICFKDTDQYTGYIHINSNWFYVLTGPNGAGDGGWSQVANSRWPFRVNLTNNNAEFGGDVNMITLTTTGNASVGGTLTESSSLRYKENVETIKYGLDKVLQMRGVTYDKKNTGVKEVGVIAEEVYDILPEVVLKNEEGEIDSVSYGRIVGVLIEAIKEQQKQIEELKSLIK